MQTGSQQLKGLDTLRALAISFVLLYHMRMFRHPEWMDTSTIIRFGWSGVDLFFVLSGFLIARPILSNMAAGKPVSFSGFFIKRILRIIPPYLLLVVIYFLIPAFREREALPPLYKFLTFTQNFGLYLNTNGTFSHVWSLCVEEHFYLAFPLVIWLLIRYKNFKAGIWLMAGLLIGGLFLRHYLWQHMVAPLVGQDGWVVTWYREMYYPTYTRLDGLLTGVGIAVLVAFRPNLVEIARFSHLILLAGLVVITAAWSLTGEQYQLPASVYGFPLVALGYGLLVLAVILPGNVFYRYGSGVTAFIAKVSFVLYLSHKGVIHLFQDWAISLGMEPRTNTLMVCSLLVATAAAWILHLIIEKPVLRVRQRLLHKKRISKPVAVPALD